MEPSFNTGIPRKRTVTYIKHRHSGAQTELFPGLYPKERSPQLFLRKGNIYHRVAIKDIVLLEADRNYTTVYTHTDKYIYSTVLKQMEKKLPADHFLRVHRSYLVNMEAVTGFEGNLLHIGNQRIPVSRSQREAVFKYFDIF